MNMNKPILLIMAAGMGSRYGGLKQLDKIDEEGNKIIDFSVYDAAETGFGKVIFIIKKENDQEFREAVGDRVSKVIPVEYVYQDLNDLPEGGAVPEGRVKPWGTAQAVLSAADALDAPFAVINADDFYGREAYRKIADFLNGYGERPETEYAMVSFILKNTLTENGYVSRGICDVDDSAFLKRVTERTRIIGTKKGAAYSEDEGKTWTDLTGDEQVSMNFWGFHPAFLPELKTAFSDFIRDLGKGNDPLKAECYLPQVVDSLIKEGKASVRVLKSSEKWFGVTYKEDRPFVTGSVKKLKDQGVYPERLW